MSQLRPGGEHVRRALHARRRAPGLPAALIVAVAVLGLACLGTGTLLALTATPRASASQLGSDPAAPSGPAAASAAPTPATAADPALAAPPDLLTLGDRLQAPVVAVGQHGHALDLPPDSRTVGWWAGGAAPGDPRGSAVLAGHVDTATQGLGALAALLDLSLGEPVAVTDAAGVVHRYVVTSRRSYPKAELPPSIFSRQGGARLVLVTCGGAFDSATGHYADNIVVIAMPTS